MGFHIPNFCVCGKIRVKLGDYIVKIWYSSKNGRLHTPNHRVFATCLGGTPCDSAKLQVSTFLPCNVTLFLVYHEESQKDAIRISERVGQKTSSTIDYALKFPRIHSRFLETKSVARPY